MHTYTPFCFWNRGGENVLVLSDDNQLDMFVRSWRSALFQIRYAQKTTMRLSRMLPRGIRFFKPSRVHAISILYGIHTACTQSGTECTIWCCQLSLLHKHMLQNFVHKNKKLWLGLGHLPRNAGATGTEVTNLVAMPGDCPVEHSPRPKK